MAASKVGDIVMGALDSSESPILAVYAKVSRRYAIYRTAQQVMIQYADDDTEGVNQRASMGPLEGVRSQVNGMIDALRCDPAAYQQTKAEQFDRRVASALAIALRGNPQQALAELAAVKEDLVEDRASGVRTRHLLNAAGATLAVILLARILASDGFAAVFGAFDPGVSPRFWTAAAIGAIGAFFSIALQIRSRQVPIDLQPWDNIIDAVLRIFVGATSAVVLIALMDGKFVQVGLANTDINGHIAGLVIAAFAAGFAERLVADFLGGVSLSARRTAPAVTTPAPIAPNPGATEQTVTGTNSPPPPPPISGGSTETLQNPAQQPMLPAAPEDSEVLSEPDEDEDETAEDEALPAQPAGSELGPVG
ncbi:MAG TPA: hypothetical protein VEZ20_15830 [Allosphingosinicella sp.]|nr:hypothetical protein [Allosphingosinicella sp.]